ncbi:MAG: hypothetical protein WBM23_12000 [Desulfomonilia bacterium]|jgi:hypothetical protein|nr:hypothetical protein [Deltaproteobacteria bacterium]
MDLVPSSGIKKEVSVSVIESTERQRTFPAGKRGAASGIKGDHLYPSDILLCENIVSCPIIQQAFCVLPNAVCTVPRVLYGNLFLRFLCERAFPSGLYY